MTKRISNGVKKQKGFTLIDILVGVSLVTIVFFGIFGAYQLGLHVIRQSQHRIVATSLANEFLERARNLSYSDVGVQGGFPDGAFLPSEVLVRNSTNYTIVSDIDFVSDSADGIIPADACPNDYKRMLFTVSWQGETSGFVSLAGDVAPANEIQECDVTGGMVSITVFDAFGIPVAAADVQVQDVDSAVSDTCVTDANGLCSMLFPASPPGGEENYKITASKIGNFSSAETFRAGDMYNGQQITTPDPAHATVFEGQITEMSFSIDQLSSLTLQTRSSKEEKTFFDTFTDTSGISSTSSVEVIGGAAQLTETGGVYNSPGQFISNTITSGTLSGWGGIQFSAVVLPNTTAFVSVLYFDGAIWVLIPDGDLPGNSTGFAASPIDLSGLEPGTYGAIRLQGDLTTTDTAVTPQVTDWQVNYFTAFVLGDRQFELRGTKIVGQDSSSNPILKYEETLQTSGSGLYSATDLEWDSYTFSINPATGLDLEEIDPSPQPISFIPDSSQTVTLYLSAQNSLLVQVEDSVSGDPVFSATVRLFKTGYDETQITDALGQTIFIPLDSGTYTIEVVAVGYDAFSDTVSVAGDATITIQIVENPS